MVDSDVGNLEGDYLKVDADSVPIDPSVECPK